MPNLLSVPFKRSYAIDIRQAVRDYISKNHTDTHPEAFRWDISRWETLRKHGVGGVAHVDRVKAALRYATGLTRCHMSLTATSYHAQLVFICTKLPADVCVVEVERHVAALLIVSLQIGLAVSYALVFSPDAPPITLANLIYERAAVLFNLGALFCQLAAAEDRSTAQGLKQAIAHYQVSALVTGEIRWCADGSRAPLEVGSTWFPL